MTVARPILWLSAIAVVVVAGCAVKEAPPATEALKTVMPPQAVIPPEWKAGGIAGDVSTAWIKTFADQQLEALIFEGLENNLQLKAAAARIDVASAVVVQV